MQEVRGQAFSLRSIALPLLVSVRFQFYFTPLPGFFSPFPRGTGSLSVTCEYLALEDGPPRFPQDCTCPAVLGNTSKSHYAFDYWAITVYGQPFQARSSNIMICNSSERMQPFHEGPATPNNRSLHAIKLLWFWLFPFRSPLLWKSHMIYFPLGT